LTIAASEHFSVKRIASLWAQSYRSLAKIANYLHAARGQLPADDFTAIAAELPFPRESIDDFLTTARCSQQNPLAFSQAITIGLSARAKMIEACAVAPADAPTERRSPRQLCLKISAEQFDLAAPLSPEQLKAAFTIGVRTVLDMQSAEGAPQAAGELLQAAE
jgi:hypothetical protein